MGLLGCMSKTITMIIRCIVFVACVFLILGSAASLWSLYSMASKVQDLDLGLPKDVFGIRHYFMEIILLAIGLVGAHGSYSNDAKYLKLFSLFIAIFAVVSFFMLATDISGADWQKSEQKFTKTMIDLSHQYQFNVPEDQEPNRATRTWDLLQASFMCCGLSDPDDWTDGSLGTGRNIPRSCCYRALPRGSQPANTCSKTQYGFFHTGCMTKIKLLVEVSVVASIVCSLVYLALGALGLILACASSRVEPGRVLTTPNGGPVYERFGGSVYVRANTNNPHQQQPTSRYNNNLPKQPPVAPLYPTMDLPPPSYTSS